MRLSAEEGHIGQETAAPGATDKGGGGVESKDTLPIMVLPGGGGDMPPVVIGPQHT